MPIEGTGYRRPTGRSSGRFDVLDLDAGAALEPKRVAKALGLSQSKVRASRPKSGGGFGAKIGAYPEDFVIAGAAMLLKRPVKWIESRSESFLAPATVATSGPSSKPALIRTENSRRLKARVLLDSGAYPKALDLAWATWVMATGRYDIPNLDYEVIGAYTNTGANGAYRGAGRPEAAYYLERVMDLIADEGGLDPAEVRRINFLKPEQFPYTTLSGEHYDTGEYEKPLNAALEIADYKGLLAEKEAALKRPASRHRTGLICRDMRIWPVRQHQGPGRTSGDVSIFTGISPHGQGQETTFAQMAEQYIGADFERTVVHHGDTATNPQGNGTMGSRGLAVGGAALLMSLNKIKDKAIRIAAFMLEAAVDDIELVDGKYQVKGVPDRGVSLADIAGKAYSGDLPDDIEVGLETTDFFKPADETFPFGTHIAVVEVLPETGEIKLLRHVCVDDCGNIITPFLVTGQVHGGLAQGLGQVILEELHYDDTGELITGTLNDYAMPRAHHFPMFESHHTTTPTYINPMGAKGIGEAATIGATPAAANAVIDALRTGVSGTWIRRSLPRKSGVPSTTQLPPNRLPTRPTHVDSRADEQRPENRPGPDERGLARRMPAWRRHAMGIRRTRQERCPRPWSNCSSTTSGRTSACSMPARG